MTMSIDQIKKNIPRDMISYAGIVYVVQYSLEDIKNTKSWQEADKDARFWTARMYPGLCDDVDRKDWEEVMTAPRPIQDLLIKVSHDLRKNEVPSWVQHKHKRVCCSFKDGTSCPHHEKGRECFFAHSKEELQSSIMMCGYGASCYKRYHYSNPCECQHPGETIDDVIERLHLQKPLPEVTQNHPTKAELRHQYLKYILTSFKECLENEVEFSQEDLELIEQIGKTARTKSVVRMCTDHLKIDIEAALKVEREDQEREDQERHERERQERKDQERQERERQQRLSFIIPG